MTYGGGRRPHPNITGVLFALDLFSSAVKEPAIRIHTMAVFL